MGRNWYRLNQTPSGQIGRDLRFLDCFKFLSMFLVVFAHTNWIIYESAISNPQDPEQLLHIYAGTLLVGGLQITLTFFVIGGFLFAINWLTEIRGKKEMTIIGYAATFVKFNIFRYLR